jgi:hypothetical protein
MPKLALVHAKQCVPRLAGNPATCLVALLGVFARAHVCARSLFLFMDIAV